MDSKAPILFLRPFEIDQLYVSNRHFLSKRKFSIKSYEELLKKAVKNLGPFVAIGKPGDKLAPLGAARAYVDDDNWQETVIKLFKKAKLVLIFIDESEGVLWELENAIKYLPPDKVILCLPLNRRGDKLDKEKYKDFLKNHHSIFASTLPESIGEAQFIYFGKNWTPHLLSPKSSQIITDIQGDDSEKILTLALNGINKQFALSNTPLFIRHPSVWVLVLLILFMFSLWVGNL